MTNNHSFQLKLWTKAGTECGERLLAYIKSKAEGWKDCQESFTIICLNFTSRCRGRSYIMIFKFHQSMPCGYSKLVPEVA